MSEDNDAERAKAAGLSRCPFAKADFSVEDGRRVVLTNSAFGAVYPMIDGVPRPVCDDAGYAPFGFGYRRCAGEFFTVEAIKDFLRIIRGERIAFVRLPSENAEKLPVGPGTVVADDIGFEQRES